MNNRFNDALTFLDDKITSSLFTVDARVSVTQQSLRLLKDVITLGRLYRDLEKTIDTHKRVAIKEEIKKLEGVEE